MTKSTSFIPAVIVAGALLILATVLLFRSPTPALGSTFPVAPAFKVATTSTAVSVTSSTRVLATTTFPGVANGYIRAYATICNPTATPVYIRLDGDKPASNNNATFIIGTTAGLTACYELTDNQISYLGSIQASSSALAVSVLVNEYTY